MLGSKRAREVPRHGPVVGERAGGRARPLNQRTIHQGELTSGWVREIRPTGRGGWQQRSRSLLLLKRRARLALLAGRQRDDLSTVSHSQGLGSRPEELSQVPGYIAVNGPPVNPQLERAVGKAARVGWLSVPHPHPPCTVAVGPARRFMLDVVCLFHVRR